MQGDYIVNYAWIKTSQSEFFPKLTRVLFQESVRSLEPGVVPVQGLVEDGHHSSEESRKA